MARIVTRCPNSGRAVSTGHWLSPPQFAALTVQHAFRCPACGSVHRWTRAEAWIEGTRAPPMPEHQPEAG